MKTLPSESFLGRAPVQDFLRAGGLQDLSGLGIAYKRHPLYPNLVLVHYSQSGSPAKNPVVCSSRGHILDEAKDWAHVCRPFDRFFPLHQETFPDPERTSFFKKEDGSLISLWHYGGKWHASSSGSPDCSGELRGKNKTLAQKFWEVFGETPSWFREDCTYIFELCTEENKVLCEHKWDRVPLIGIRENLSGKEFKPTREDFREPPREIEVQGEKELWEMFYKTPPLDFEGVVSTQYLPDGRVQRYKLIHPGYTANKNLLRKGTEANYKKALVELIRSGDVGEVLEYFPEYSREFFDMRESYESLVFDLEEALARLAPMIEDRKTFALEAKRVRMGAILFRVLREKCTIRYALGTTSPESLLEHIDRKPGV